MNPGYEKHLSLSSSSTSPTMFECISSNLPLEALNLAPSDRRNRLLRDGRGQVQGNIRRVANQREGALHHGAGRRVLGCGPGQRALSPQIVETELSGGGLWNHGSLALSPLQIRLRGVCPF